MKQRILFILLLLPFAGVAQFSDSVHHMVNFTSTGTANNTDDGSSYLFNNSLKAGIKKKKISLNSAAGWLYGETDDGLTNNDFNALLDFDVYTSLPHFYYWGLATYTTSYSLDVNSQYQAGAGAAYNVFDRPEARVNLSDGILFEGSDLQLDDTTSDQYHTFRNSFRLLLHFVIRKNLVISSTTLLQNSLNYGNDYIIKSNSSISFKLNKWLSLTTAFTYNKVSRTDNSNMMFSYGLTVEKYF